MSNQSLRQRAADVRAHWTYRERQQRAKAGHQRCLELLARIGLARQKQAPAWAATAPKVVSAH
jgi:hypothetical protein